MVNKSLLPLALIYANENQRPIDGATRFQKLVFLAQEELDVEEIVGGSFEYQSDRFGPFSPELAATLEQLEDRGFIEKKEENTRAGNEKHIFRLTDKGRAAVRNLHNKKPHVGQLLEASSEVMDTYGDRPFERLLRYVYTNYDEYTDQSELEL